MRWAIIAMCLQDMTYTPLMGEWLTYAGNEKANPETGAAPDENFAREIMQLFTIGLVELQQNGRPRLVNGQEVETYDNTDITELAKVFTGLDWDNWWVFRAELDRLHELRQMMF